MSLEPDLPASPDWGQMIHAVAASRDQEAFSRLFAHFAPRIMTFMRRAGAVEQEAEELAQEAMILVWRKAELFDPRTAGASAWIFTIARNVRIDRFRRARRNIAHVGIDSRTEDIMAGDMPADDVLAANEVESRVRRALADLPQSQLRVVELSFFEEKAHGEIAETLGLPLGTVKSRLRLAMDKLRTMLEDIQ